MRLSKKSTKKSKKQNHKVNNQVYKMWDYRLERILLFILYIIYIFNTILDV